MEKWVVHIGSGRWQKAAIEETNRRGYRPLAVDGDPKAVGFSVADHSLVENITSISATLDAVIGFFEQKDLNPEGILCIASEAGQLSAAALREHYNLKGIKSKVAKNLTDKSQQRNLWSGLKSSPRFLIVTNSSDLSLPEGLSRTKLIVKPVDSAGSRGITVLESEQHDRISGAVDFALKYSNSKKAVIEEFINGQEYTLESIVINGKTHPLIITEKDKVKGTCGTVANKLTIAQISASVSQKIVKAVSEGHERLNHESGVSHAEVIVDKDENVWLVEVAGRGAGFAVSEKFIEFSTGFKYLDASIDFCLSEKVGVPTKLDIQPSCIRFFETVPGCLENIRFPDIDGVLGLQILDEGTDMNQPTSDGDRVGLAMIKASTFDELAEKLDYLEKNTVLTLKHGV